MNVHKLFAVCCLIAALVAMTGCEEEPRTTSLRLALSSSIEDSARTITPNQQSLEIHSYYISGVGPNGKTFSVTTLSPQVIIEGLVLGTWTITAKGQNLQGTDLVSGTTEHQLTTTATRADILMGTLVGNGNIKVTFLWGEVDFPDIELNLYLTPQGGSETNITTGIVIIESTARAVFETSLPAGSYELRYELFSQDIKVDGGTEALRVINNALTEGTLDISLDKLVSVAPGISITTELTTPVEGLISGIGSVILPNTTANVEFAQTGGGGSTDIAVRWFLDGELFATGLSTSFSTFTGSHRLDVIANTSQPGSVGSVSWPFQATVQNNAGVPIAIMSIENGDIDSASQPFKLNQITDAAFLRDGKLLIASQNSLQLCKIVQDKLVVVRNFTDGGATASVATEPYPVYGVTDIVVDLLDDMVCTTASSTGTMVVYAYDSATGNLVKKGYKSSDPTLYAEQQWTIMSNPVLDTSRNLIYFFDAGGVDRYVFYYAYGSSGFSYVGSASIDATSSPANTNPSQLSISGDFRRLGMVSPANGSFHLMSNQFNGYNNDPASAIMLDRADPAGAAALLSGMVFNQTDFYTFKAAGISRYTTLDNGGSYVLSSSLGAPLNTVSAMVFNNTNTKAWVVSAGVNPGISLLALGSTEPTHQGFTSSGTFKGKRIAISPLGDLLCVVGDSSDLTLYRVSDGLN